MATTTKQVPERQPAAGRAADKPSPGPDPLLVEGAHRRVASRALSQGTPSPALEAAGTGQTEEPWRRWARDLDAREYQDLVQAFERQVRPRGPGPRPRPKVRPQREVGMPTPADYVVRGCIEKWRMDGAAAHARADRAAKQGGVKRADAIASEVRRLKRMYGWSDRKIASHLRASRRTVAQILGHPWKP